MTEWFGAHLSLAKDLSLALQFVKLNKDQIIQMEKSNFPATIRTLYQEIQKSQYTNDNAFQLNVYYSTEVSSKTKSDIQQLVNYEEGKSYPLMAIKKVNYKRCSQDEIVDLIRKQGYQKFSSQEHQKILASENGQQPFKEIKKHLNTARC